MGNMLYAVIAFVAAMILLFTRIKFMVKGVKVKAQIKEYICPKGAYIPIMEFEHDGQVMNIKAKNGWKNQKYDIGTEMEVFYIPGNEKEVKIISDYSDLLYAALFFVCGVVIVICLKFR